MLNYGVTCFIRIGMTFIPVRNFTGPTRWGLIVTFKGPRDFISLQELILPKSLRVPQSPLPIIQIRP